MNRGVSQAGVSNNFDLVDDLPEAVRKIKAGGAQNTVRGGPDRSGAHARWYEFAKLAILIADPTKPEDQEMKAFWEKMLPILLEGTMITTKILDKSLTDGWPDSEKAQRLSDAEIAAIRKAIAGKSREDLDKMFQEQLTIIARDKSNTGTSGGRTSVFLPYP